MTDRPIIFSAPMVNALIDGRKSQTHRMAGRDNGKPTVWQKAAVGDRIWVRESFAILASRHVPKPGGGYKWCEDSPMYAADYIGFDKPDRDWNWKPSIHMPRGFSRLTLLVTAVRMERLQEITEAEAEAEGAPLRNCGQDWDGPIKSHRTGFVYLWRDLHGPDSWGEDPECIALSFTVHQCNIDHMEAE